MTEPELIHELLDDEEWDEGAPPLKVGERNELEISIGLWRRFLGVSSDETQEVIGFVRGKPWVGYARSEAEQIAMLRRAERSAGFAGAYLLLNSIDSRIAERYTAGDFGPAHAGRASDKEILLRRAVFIDVDPVRPKGISATDAEREAARDVATKIRDLLTARCGRESIGFGTSGNGYFLLVAIEPVVPAKDHGLRIKRLLDGLQARFGTAAASIDGTVHNAARLMPAPGTMKCKGAGSSERPHRMTSFSCSHNAPIRVPLEVIA